MAGPRCPSLIIPGDDEDGAPDPVIDLVYDLLLSQIGEKTANLN